MSTVTHARVQEALKRLKLGHVAEQLDAAVRAAHTAFDLDSTEGEAIVYGGTGR